jgi:hypothetical protein
MITKENKAEITEVIKSLEQHIKLGKDNLNKDRDVSVMYYNIAGGILIDLIDKITPKNKKPNKYENL